MDERIGDGERDQVLDAVGAAFARLRRRTALVDVDPPVTRKDMSRNQVINIVDEAAGEITVGGVAEQLAVDPSVASRMVTESISDGYLVRKASQRDGRRTVLELSEEGIRLRDRFRDQHRQAFLKITHDWPELKRLTFARLLIEYADASVALTNPRHDHDTNRQESPQTASSGVRFKTDVNAGGKQDSRTGVKSGSVSPTGR